MRIECLTVSVVSATGGAATATVAINGIIRGIEIKADSGATQPTNDFDLSIATKDGFVIFADTGIANNATEFNIPSKLGTGNTAEGILYAYAGPLALTFANMGDAKGCKVNFYVER